MNHTDAESRIARLIAATHADADPAVLDRARARVSALAESAEPAWVRWLARPTALAVSGGLLAMSVAAGGWLLRGASATTPTAASATESVAISELLADDGTYGLTFEEPAFDQASVGDSGRSQ